MIPFGRGVVGQRFPCGDAVGFGVLGQPVLDHHQARHAENGREVGPFPRPRQPGLAGLALEVAHPANLQVDLRGGHPGGVQLRAHLFEELSVGERALGVLGEVIRLELHVRHAVRVHVVLRQVQEIERLRRARIRRPRQLHDRVEVQRHQRDARELLGRDVRAAPAAAPSPLAATGRRLCRARETPCRDRRGASRALTRK